MVNSIRTVTLRGKTFLIHSDPNSEQICQQDICKGLTWEPWLTDYILDNLEKDSTFIDAGASIGWFTLLAAVHAPKGHIISFEPHEERFKTMTRSVAENKLKNVTLHQSRVIR